MANPKVRQYAGDFRMWRKAPNGALTPVIPEPTDPDGNQPIETDAFTFSYEPGDEISIKSKRLGAKYGQPIYADQQPGVTSLSVTLLEIPTALFARILYAEIADASVAGSSVTDAPYQVTTLAAPLQLTHRYIAASPAPVVKKGVTTLVAGTDYVIDRVRGKLMPKAGGAIDANDNILVSYTYLAVTATEFLGGATPTESFYITGDMEDRINGDKGDLVVFEVKLSVDGDVDWLSAEPISPVMTGVLVVPDGAPAPYKFTSYEQAA